MLFRHLFFALLALGLLLPAACRRNTPDVPAVDTWTHAGFLAQVPADAEAFLLFQQPREIFAELSRLLTPATNDPALRTVWQNSPWWPIAAEFHRAPAAAPLWPAWQDAAHHEFFVVLGTGAAAQLSDAQKIVRFFAAARLRNLFTPGAEIMTDLEPVPLEPAENWSEAAFTEVMTPLPPAMEEALEKFVRDAAVPPLMLAAKISDTSPLPTTVRTWMESLPPQIPRDEVTFPPHGNFSRVRIPLSLLVPSSAAIKARDILAAQIGDPYRASHIVRQLLSSPCVISCGRIGEYFVVTAGTEDGRPLLASEPERSLTTLPIVQQIQPWHGASTAALLYAAEPLVRQTSRPPPLHEYLDAAMESAYEFAPADRIKPLQSAAADLRRQIDHLFNPHIAPLAAALLRDNRTWTWQSFGGSLAPRFARENATPVFSTAAPAPVVWNENWQPGYAGHFLNFIDGLTHFISAWVEALRGVFPEPLAFSGLPQLPVTPETLIWINEAISPQFGLVAAARRNDAFPEFAVAAAVGDADSWNASTPALLRGATLINDRALFAFPSTYAATAANFVSSEGSSPGVQLMRMDTALLADSLSAWSAQLRSSPDNMTNLSDHWLFEPEAIDSLAAMFRTPRRITAATFWEDKMLRRTLTLEPTP